MVIVIGHGIFIFIANYHPKTSRKPYVLVCGGGVAVQSWWFPYPYIDWTYKYIEWPSHQRSFDPLWSVHARASSVREHGVYVPVDHTNNYCLGYIWTWMRGDVKITRKQEVNELHDQWSIMNTWFMLWSSKGKGQKVQYTTTSSQCWTYLRAFSVLHYTRTWTDDNMVFHQIKAVLSSSLHMNFKDWHRHFKFIILKIF